MLSLTIFAVAAQAAGQMPNADQNYGCRQGNIVVPERLDQSPVFTEVLFTQAMIDSEPLGRSERQPRLKLVARRRPEAA